MVYTEQPQRYEDTMKPFMTTQGGYVTLMSGHVRSEVDITYVLVYNILGGEDGYR